MFKFLAVIAVFAFSCSKDGRREDDLGGGVNLFLGRVQVPMLDSVSVLVYGDDMEDVRTSANSIAENIKINGIPIGEARHFEVKVYADKGKLVQSGVADADIKSNETITIPIKLYPLMGFLKIEVPLGLANLEEIHSGTLFLDELEYTMKIEKGKGIFNTGALEFKTYNLKIELKDINNRIAFAAEKTLQLNSDLQNETILLESKRASVILEISQGGSEKEITATLPGSTLRKPMFSGDVLFAEIFANPGPNKDSLEYLKIYNATLDTLNLLDCTVGKNSEKNTVTTSFKIEEELAVPPMKYSLLGREHVLNADYYYTGLKLSNSGQSLVFFCDDVVADSLYYGEVGVEELIKRL